MNKFFPPLIYIGGAMASSAVNSALNLLEPTLASNGEPTRGRWGRDELTYGFTIQFHNSAEK